MTKIKDILQFLETAAPTYMKMKWDNVGLLCGDTEQSVQRFWLRWTPFTVYVWKQRKSARIYS